MDHWFVMHRLFTSSQRAVKNCLMLHCRCQALVLAAAMPPVSMSTHREACHWCPGLQLSPATSHSWPTMPLLCLSMSRPPVLLTLVWALACLLMWQCPLATQKLSTTALAWSSAAWLSVMSAMAWVTWQCPSRSSTVTWPKCRSLDSRMWAALQCSSAWTTLPWLEDLLLTHTFTVNCRVLQGALQSALKLK